MKLRNASNGPSVFRRRGGHGGVAWPIFSDWNPDKHRKRRREPVVLSLRTVPCTVLAEQGRSGLWHSRNELAGSYLFRLLRVQRNNFRHDNHHHRNQQNRAAGRRAFMLDGSACVCDVS